MSLFKQFGTDAAAETAGVKVEFGPNEDKTVPTFHLSRMGKSNKRYSKALELATRPYRRQIELGTMSNDVADKLFLEVFVSTILLGWDNVQDREGKAMAFTKENAVELMGQLPELYDDLQEKAKSAALFRETALEDEAKN